MSGLPARGSDDERRRAALCLAEMTRRAHGCPHEITDQERADLTNALDYLGLREPGAVPHAEMLYSTWGS